MWRAMGSKGPGSGAQSNLDPVPLRAAHPDRWHVAQSIFQTIYWRSVLSGVQLSRDVVKESSPNVGGGGHREAYAKETRHHVIKLPRHD
jgi:hypothetical protein